jgi:hypothetical protein
VIIVAGGHAGAQGCFVAAAATISGSVMRICEEADHAGTAARLPSLLFLERCKRSSKKFLCIFSILNVLPAKAGMMGVNGQGFEKHHNFPTRRSHHLKIAIEYSDQNCYTA